jgi:hypothetical protein
MGIDCNMLLGYWQSIQKEQIRIVAKSYANLVSAHRI